MSGIFDQVINYAPPSLLLGTVTYKGTWSAATNTPTLPNPPSAITNGNYYVVSAAGTQFSLSFNIGDWIISNGSAWEKVDNTDAVSSVFGRTGAVVGVSTDYSAVGITATAVGASSPSTGAFTTLSATTPLAVASGGTGVASSTGTTNVVLSGSPTITTPVIAQINDANGNETLKLASIASAVNEVTIENAATGNAVHISATGGDASVGLHLAGKGASGYVNVQDSTDATKRIMFNASGGTTNTRTMLSSTQTVDRILSLPDATDTLVGKATTDTLTNKTLTSPTITGGALNGTLGATTPSSVAATTGTFSSTLGVTGVATLGNGAILGTPASGTVTNLTGTASININGTVGATTASTIAATTVTATGTISSTVGNAGTAFDSQSATTGYIHGVHIKNTSGELYLGLEGTTAGTLITGDSAYDTTVRSLTPISFSASGGSALHARITSTGLNSTAIGATTPSTIAGTTGTFSGKIKKVDSITTTVDWLEYETGWTNPSGNKSIIWKDTTSPLGRISVSYAGGVSSMSFGSLYSGGYLTADSMVLTTAGAAITGTLSATDTISTTKAVASAGNIVSIKNSTDTGGDNTRYAGVNFLVGSDDGTSSIRSYRTNSATNYETALAFLTNPSGATQIPTEKMRIDSSGNVGIGTTSPASILHLKKDGSGNGVSTTFEVNTGTSTNWRIGCQNNVSNGFEITPSTSAGGSTFSTPVVTVTTAGAAITGTLSASGSFTASNASKNASGNYIIGGLLGGATYIDSANSGDIYIRPNGTQVGQFSTAGLAVTGTLSASGVSTLTGGAVIQGLTVGRGAGAVSGNVAVGPSVLAANTTGGGIVAIGNTAAASCSTADNITAVGAVALSGATGGNNTAFGFNAGGNVTSGTNNTCIGNSSATDGVRNITTGSNEIVMGNNSHTAAYIKIAWTVSSDARDKTSFAPVPLGLDFVNSLTPTAYQFRVSRDDDTPTGPIRYGFKAQDILAAEGSNSVIIDSNDPENLKYNSDSLIATLVNSIKELTARLAALESK